MRLKIPVVIAVAVIAAPCSTVHAQTVDVGTGNRLIAGLGVSTVPDYEGSDERRLAPVPVLAGQQGGYAFTVIGNRASIDLIRNEPGPVWDIQAGPAATLNLNRSSSSSISDARVRALGSISPALEIGGFVGVAKTGVLTSAYDNLSLRIAYRRDVTGISRSSVLTPTISYLTPLSPRSLVSVFVSADRVGDGYAETYFSVSAAGAAASGLPVFTAHRGWKNVTAGGFATRSLTGDLRGGISVVGGVVYRRLAGDFAASPITAIAGSRHQWTGELGLAFTF